MSNLLSLKLIKYYFFAGLITEDEFEEACRSLNRYSKSGRIPLEGIKDLAKTLDINKDGAIDFNEFLEAFRLVSVSVELGVS